MNSIKSNTIHKGILFCMEIPHIKLLVTIDIVLTYAAL